MAANQSRLVMNFKLLNVGDGHNENGRRAICIESSLAQLELLGDCEENKRKIVRKPLRLVSQCAPGLSHDRREPEDARDNKPKLINTFS